MYNPILWTLDNQTNGDTFERLCVDLLSREGYSHIVPIGGVHDRGRDAEIREFATTVTFFQFSLEKGWLSKLRRELKKVRQNGHEVDTYIFVTSLNVTGRKRDSLRTEVQREYGWQLVIYDREWLRNRLEEQHPDLAVKYLGVSATTPTSEYAPNINKSQLPQHPATKGNLYLDQGNYEAAVVEFKRYLDTHPNDTVVWQLLAASQYYLEQYTDALVSINQALKAEPDNRIWLTAKTAILAEDGLKHGDRAKLVMAKKTFEQFATESNDWLDHYNFANVLQGLGEFERARDEYEQAIQCDGTQASVWNNLGNTYFALQDYDEAMKCYDKALELKPTLAQALASKGTALIQVYGKADEAIPLLEQAMSIEGLGWLHGWYWLGVANCELNKWSIALRYINEGLGIMPSNPSLLNLKAMVYQELWRLDASYVEEAIEFFEFLQELGGTSFNAMMELSQLYMANGQEQKAIDIVINNDLSDEELEAIKHVAFEFQLKECILGIRYAPIYLKFRQSVPIESYITPLTDIGIAFPETLLSQFDLATAVAFGVAYDAMATAEASQRIEVYEQLLEPTIQRLRKAIVFIYNEIHSVNDSLADEQLFKIKVFVMEFAAREWTSQLGWVCGKFRLDFEEYQRIHDAYTDKDNTALDKLLYDIADFIKDEKELTAE